jgi:hypothetical protein
MYEKLGPIYADIGSEVAQIVGGDPDGSFLYAEAGEGWYGASVFKDEGELVRYYDPSPELSDLIYDAWLTADPDKRWSIMEYDITGTKFNVRFQYPDEVPVETFADDDRREIALKKRYGDKPVIYPPWPGQDAD